MPASGNCLVAQRLVTTILYKLLRLIFITVQYIYWQLNGTARKRREARLPQNYERSAQVLDVVFFHKFCHMIMMSVSDFLVTHNRFENPQYIIDNDNITLLTVNEHDAIFCEAKEKGNLHLFVNGREYLDCRVSNENKLCLHWRGGDSSFRKAYHYMQSCCDIAVS